MWEIDHAGQIYTFLASLPVGGAFSLFYEIFRLIRVKFNVKGLFLFLVDLVFFIPLAFVGFCFLLVYTSGEIRGFVWVGFILGFLAFSKTVSPLWYRLLNLVAWCVLKLFSIPKRLIFIPVGHFFEKTGVFLIKMCKKTRFFIKKCLKNNTPLVYTKEKCPQEGKGKEV